MSPGAATAYDHHHFCNQEVILKIEHYDVGACYVCGQYLFIYTSDDETTYSVATGREKELIISIMALKGQIARTERG